MINEINAAEQFFFPEKYLHFIYEVVTKLLNICQGDRSFYLCLIREGHFFTSRNSFVPSSQSLGMQWIALNY